MVALCEEALLAPGNDYERKLLTLLPEFFEGVVALLLRRLVFEQVIAGVEDDDLSLVPDVAY